MVRYRRLCFRVSDLSFRPTVYAAKAAVRSALSWMVRSEGCQCFRLSRVGLLTSSGTTSSKDSLIALTLSSYSCFSTCCVRGSLLRQQPPPPPYCSAAACAAAQGGGSPAAHLWHPPRRPGTLRGQTPYAPCCAPSCGGAAPAEGPPVWSSLPAAGAAPALR
jgi:hypothetical protein